MSKTVLLWALLVLPLVINAGEETPTPNGSQATRLDVESVVKKARDWLLRRANGDSCIVLTSIRQDCQVFEHVALTDHDLQAVISNSKLKGMGSFDARTYGYTQGNTNGKKVAKAQLKKANDELAAVKADWKNQARAEVDEELQVQLLASSSELQKVRAERDFWKKFGVATVVIGGITACTMYAFRNR